MIFCNFLIGMCIILFAIVLFLVLYLYRDSIKKAKNSILDKKKQYIESILQEDEPPIIINDGGTNLGEIYKDYYGEI